MPAPLLHRAHVPCGLQKLDGSSIAEAMRVPIDDSRLGEYFLQTPPREMFHCRLRVAIAGPEFLIVKGVPMTF